MSPTECFKKHDIPFGERGDIPEEGKNKIGKCGRVSRPPRCPQEQMAYLGAPRLGAMTTTASWSPFSMEMKTPLVVGH